MRVLQRHAFGIAVLAALGLAAGALVGGEWPSSGSIVPAPSTAMIEKLSEERQATAAAGQRAEATKAKVTAAESDEGAGGQVDAGKPEVGRVLTLQTDLLAAETKRVQQEAETSGSGAELDGGAARHREDLLRITYDRQLASLPAAQQKAVAMQLLRAESKLDERVYGELQARLKDSEASAKLVAPEMPFLSSPAAHRLLASGFGMLAFGLFGVGWFLYRDSCAHWSSQETGHDLSWAEASVDQAQGSLFERPQRFTQTAEDAVSGSVKTASAPEPAGSEMDTLQAATPVAGDADVPAESVQAPTFRAASVEAVSAEPDPAENTLPLAQGASDSAGGSEDELPTKPGRNLDGPRYGVIPTVADASRGLARVINQASESEFPQSRDVFLRTEWSDAAGPLEEACRDTLASLLLADWGKGIRSYAIVSSSAGDGKTTVLANMAMAMGRAQLRVVVVEGNLRNPRLHEMFDVQGVFGLRNILRGEMDLEHAPIDDLTSRTLLSHVAVVVAGTGEEEPADWVTSAAFRQLLERLSLAFDLVLLDTSSEPGCGDGIAAAQRCGAAIQLLRAGEDGAAKALQTRDALVASGVPVAGIVLNRSMGEVDGSGYF